MAIKFLDEKPQGGSVSFVDIQGEDTTEMIEERVLPGKKETDIKISQRTIAVCRFSSICTA